MDVKIFKIENLVKINDSMHLEKTLNKFKSVKAYVNIASKKATLKYKPNKIKIETLVEVMESMGFHTREYTDSGLSILYLEVDYLDGLNRHEFTDILYSIDGVCNVFVKNATTSAKIYFDEEKTSVKKIRKILKKNKFYTKPKKKISEKAPDMEVTDVIGITGVSGRTLLFYAMAAMQNVNSEIAQALSEFAEKNYIQTAQLKDIEYADKYGAIVELKDREITAGTTKFFKRERIPVKELPKLDKGKEGVHVNVNGEMIGSVIFSKGKNT